MRFWDEEIETLKKQKLRELQLERLKRTLRRVYQKVPHYRAKFQQANVKPEDIKHIEDVNKLPFTIKEDLYVDYPFGLVTLPLDKLIRLHTSSGTTGKPKAIFFSKKDINNSAELIARCLVMTGAQRGDILQNSMTYGLFTGAFVMHYGAEKIGILVIPAGPGNTERQINLMKDFGTTMLHITPSYALYVASVMNQRGIDPRRELKLRKAYLGAEPYSEETRKKIEDMLGIDIYNCYGLTEMNGPGVGFECKYKAGLHIWEDNFFMEIINPDTGDPVPDGGIGELVLTTLNREAMPLVRYRTRDLTRMILEPCKCGRTHRRVSRILGRSDDMFIVKGVNIFPQQIEQVLMSTKGVAQNYQIVLESFDEMTVKVEIDRELFDGRIEKLVKMKEEIVDKIRSSTMVKPKVELLEPGTLPISEGKAKRVIDNRTI